MTSRKRKRPVGGGGARNPASLANLRQGGPPNAGSFSSGRSGPRLSHGAYREIAREAIDEKSREIQAALEADVPVAGSWGVPIRLLAETLLRLDSVTDHLRRRGWEAEDGSIRPAVEVEGALQRRALDLARELGLTPLAASKLGLNVARGAAAGFDLAAALADLDDEDENVVDGSVAADG